MKTLRNRFLSLLLCMALLVAWIPVTSQATTPKDPPPQTGDYSMIAWYAVLALSCGGVLTLLTLRKKKAFRQSNIPRRRTSGG